MQSPTNIKEVQRLTGRLAALSRFLPCLASKSHSFFQCLKKDKKFFTWTEECEKAFADLKQLLSKPPILQKPKLGKPLYLYLSITDVAISSVLTAEEDKQQRHVYFVSKSLQNAELRYPRLEKLALALVFSARRLRPYFQSHPIIVRTDYPLRQILSKPELAGRLIKWSIELSEFDISYQPRGTIKPQWLADFVAELTSSHPEQVNQTWTLFVDGASNPQGSGAGILLESSDGIVLEHSLRFSFKASNNQAEYEALIAGLKLAADLNITNLTILCDSLLVVQQVNRSFQVKDQTLQKYLDVVQQLLANFLNVKIHHIPREQNHRADVLSTLATTQAHTAKLLQSTLDKPSIDTIRILTTLNKDSWQKSISKHPQSNGLAEAANKVLLQALRKKLDNAKGAWAELILEVLWAYNTTTHSTTKETPFRLVYGSEAMIPIEVSQSSLRTQAINHDQARLAELDLVEEIRDIAAIRHRALQQQLARRYSKKVIPKGFQIGDLVLRKTEQARRPSTHGKLAATWDGPYRICEVLGKGAYKLEHLDGDKISSTWNVHSLKRYYS
nr:uncharacterized protein LOC112805264 [Arachis hypogaea]